VTRGGGRHQIYWSGLHIPNKNPFNNRKLGSWWLQNTEPFSIHRSRARRRACQEAAPPSGSRSQAKSLPKFLKSPWDGRQYRNGEIHSLQKKTNMAYRRKKKNI
jgi:hypothetical protein